MIMPNHSSPAFRSPFVRPCPLHLSCRAFVSASSSLHFLRRLARAPAFEHVACSSLTGEVADHLLLSHSFLLRHFSIFIANSMSRFRARYPKLSAALGRGNAGQFAPPPNAVIMKTDDRGYSMLPSSDARFELELCYRTDACNVGSITIAAPLEDVRAP